MSSYEKVVSVISRPPDQRTDFEVAAILPYLRKRNHVFESVRIDLLKDIIRNCKFGTKKRDDIIIKQGEVGDCFYVILSGQISIYIHNQDRGDEEEKQELLNIVQYKDGLLDRSKLGNFVTTLGEGNTVGEVALIDETCVRTASIVADSKTDLVIVDKPLYNRCVKETLAKEFEDKRQFIANNSLFSSWAPKYTKQLTMAMYKQAWPYDSVLVRQGDQVDFFYFILRGQVEIQMDPSTHPVQYGAIFKAAIEKEAVKFMKRSTKIAPLPETIYSNNIRKRDNFKSTRLCYLGINETVGDTEMTMDLRTYMQTAVCKEPTEVLVLEKKHYERLFERRHPRTIDAMRQQIGVKLLTRKSLLSSKDDIPFLGYLAKIIEAHNRPQAATEKDRLEPTVSEAEKEFLNHKGPLIDLHGPGSVFYLIKMRERTKLRVRAKRDRIPQPGLALPASVLMAAQQLLNGSHDPREEDRLSARGQSRVKVAQQPRSFRSIQSAHKDVTATVESREAVEAEQNEQQHPSPTQEENGYECNGDNSLDLSDTWGQLRGGQADDLTNNGGGEDAQLHDARLSFLEERIRNWLKKDNPRGQGGPHVAQLRRLTALDLEQQPRPGNKVVIRRRRRVVSENVMDSDNPRPKKDDSRTEPFKILLTNSL